MYEIEEGRYESSRRKRRFFLFVILIIGFSLLLIMYINQYNKVVKLNYEIISVKKDINDEELEKQKLNKLINVEISKVVENGSSGYRMPEVNNIIWVEEPVWFRFLK